MGRFGSQVLGGGRRLIFGSLAIAACATAQQLEPAVFTADVRLVSLPVTVKDARGAPVGDLKREDFQVFESDEQREITVFERRTDRPLSVVLLMDASLSTAVELRYERESAGRFLGRLLGRGSKPDDAAAVFSFSSDVTVLADFTRNQKELATALGRVRPQTGTSVYDAVLLASRYLQQRDGRPVIVIITDGGDTTSGLKFDDALRAAHAAEAAIYPLIVLPIRSDAGRNRGGEHALITLAKHTGGEAFVQHGARDLDTAFDEVLRNLRTQYLLGFYPADEGFNPADDFRKVEVGVAREGAVVLARSGYFAKSPVKQPARRSRIGAPVRLRTVPQVGVPDDADEEAAEPITRPPRRSRGRKTPIVRPGP